jgi:hypothetical protein
MIRAASFLIVLIATVAILSAGLARSASADPLAGADGATATVHATPAGYDSPGYFSGYLPPPPVACSVGSHYACWYGAYGGRHCGCWAGGDHPACPYGFHFSCRYDGFGGRYCACF